MERVGGCTPDGKLDISFEKYFESLYHFRAGGGKLSPDESRLLSLWESIEIASTISDRYAMDEYELVVNALDKPQTEMEKFLYQKAMDGLLSLRNSDDDFVWERITSNYF